MRIKNLAWLSVSLIIIAFDQWSKAWVVAHLPYLQPVSVIPHYFNLFLIHNPGAAFSFLAQMPGWQRWFFFAIAMIVSLILLKWQVTLPSKQSIVALALSLIIGGAIANAIDRIRLGFVIDFIQVYYQNYYCPAFNVADSAVVVGAILLILYFTFHREPHD